MKIYKAVFFTLLALFFVGCSFANKTDSPTETLKKFVEASQKKEVEAMKETLSGRTLQMIQESAAKQNTTVEELLRKDDANALREMPEMRNEVIEGDTATVEVKNKATGDWDKIPFVREEGKWKLALDKYMQDVMRKTTEDMRMPNNKRMPADAANSTNPSDSPAADNK